MVIRQQWRRHFNIKTRFPRKNYGDRKHIDHLPCQPWACWLHGESWRARCPSDVCTHVARAGRPSDVSHDVKRTARRGTGPIRTPGSINKWFIIRHFISNVRYLYKHLYACNWISLMLVLCRQRSLVKKRCWHDLKHYAVLKRIIASHACI